MTIQKRLRSLKKKYSLSTTDLSVLLKSGRSTVFGWERSVSPSASKGPLIERRLAMVERAANSAAKPFPVPLEVTQYRRKQYLLESINDFDKPRISKSGSAPKRGAVLLDE